MRLIDADALKAEWYRLNDIKEEDCGARFVGYQEIARLINNAPTVEPNGDLISRADAIEAVKHSLYETAMNNMEHGDVYVDIAENRIGTWLSALPSAKAVSIHEDGTLEVKVQNAQKVGRVLVMDTDSHIGGGLFYPDDAEAESIVIRSRTLLPTKDFKEWAKRIREENPNAVVIPCDAEVVSAEAVQGEWVDVDNYYRLATCSNCQKVTMFEKWGEYTKPYNFCPNCGARMKGGDDNADTD